MEDKHDLIMRIENAVSLLQDAGYELKACVQAIERDDNYESAETHYKQALEGFDQASEIIPFLDIEKP